MRYTDHVGKLALYVHASHLGYNGSGSASDVTLSQRQCRTADDRLQDLWAFLTDFGVQPLLKLRQHFTIHSMKAMRRA